MPAPLRVVSPDPTAPPGLVCSWTVGGGLTGWMRLAGELDIATAPQLAQSLRGAPARAHLVVLDLRDLAFMDSAGARTIDAAGRHARSEGRRLVLIHATRPVGRVFALTDLADAVEIMDVSVAAPPRGR